MPLKPSFGDRVASPVVSLYANAERAILKWLARVLMPIPGAQWVIRMLARLFKLRRGTKRIVGDLDRESERRVRRAIDASWEHGADTAADDLGIDRSNHAGSQSDRLTREVFARIAATHPRIGAWAESVFRRAVDAGRDPSLTDAERAAAVQRILDQAAEPGVTGYVDPSGRRHNLVSYVETTVRAAATFAEVEAYVSTLSAQGHDLVVVSDVPQACALCRPFEGRVLSIAGAPGARTVQDTRGRSVTVVVYASIAQARARGLWHPGCRHVVSVWTADSPLPPADTTPDPAGYQAQQRRRALERRVRAKERVVDVAQSRPAERDAKRKLAEAKAHLHRERLPMDPSDKGTGANGEPAVPRIPPSPYDSATTNLEVAQLLQLRHRIPVDGFDMPGVPLDFVKEYARALDDMLTRYPSMNIGEIRIADLLDPRYEKSFAVTVGRRDATSRKWFAESMTLNGHYATRPDLLWQASLADAADGYHIPELAQRPIYTTIVHEFGHVIDHNLDHEPRRDVIPALEAHRDQAFPLSDFPDSDARDTAYNQWLAQLPGYCFDDTGALNPVEALAEAFAAVEIQGESASEPAKVLHRMLMDQLRRLT